MCVCVCVGVFWAGAAVACAQFRRKERTEEESAMAHSPDYPVIASKCAVAPAVAPAVIHPNSSFAAVYAISASARPCFSPGPAGSLQGSSRQGPSPTPTNSTHCKILTRTALKPKEAIFVADPIQHHFSLAFQKTVWDTFVVFCYYYSQFNTMLLLTVTPAAPALPLSSCCATVGLVFRMLVTRQAWPQCLTGDTGDTGERGYRA